MPRRPRSKNPTYRIHGTGAARRASRRFGDGNLKQDAAIADAEQKRLRREFWVRLGARVHPRDRETRTKPFLKQIGAARRAMEPRPPTRRRATRRARRC